MRVLFGRDEEVATWVWQQIYGSVAPEWGPCVAIGVVNEATLRCAAGVVFHRFSGHNIELSIAAVDPRWARRDVIRGILAYAFEQAGATRITTINSVHNTRAHKLARGIGFEREGLLRRGWDGNTDAYVWGALRADVARWLPPPQALAA